MGRSTAVSGSTSGGPRARPAAPRVRYEPQPASPVDLFPSFPLPTFFKPQPWVREKEGSTRPVPPPMRAPLMMCCQAAQLGHACSDECSCLDDLGESPGMRPGRAPCDGWWPPLCPLQADHPRPDSCAPVSGLQVRSTARWRVPARSAGKRRRSPSRRRRRSPRAARRRDFSTTAASLTSVSSRSGAASRSVLRQRWLRPWLRREWCLQLRSIAQRVRRRHACATPLPCVSPSPGPGPLLRAAGRARGIGMCSFQPPPFWLPILPAKAGPGVKGPPVSSLLCRALGALQPALCPTTQSTLLTNRTSALCSPPLRAVVGPGKKKGPNSQDKPSAA